MKNNKIALGRAFKSYYVTALFVIFFLGFFLGWFYNDSTLDETSLLLEESQLNINSFNYALLFAEELNISLCNLEMIDYMEEVIFESGQELILLEETSNDYSEEYLILKQKHNVNQVLFYTYYRNHYTSCDNSEDIILFFFNSSEEQSSEEQGKVLNQIVDTFDVRVIAMDYKFTESLDFFYDFYSTDNLPTLVINYDTILMGDVSYEELALYFLSEDE